MKDEVRQLLSDLDKPIKVKECIECGYILPTKTIPDTCPNCKRTVEK
jgi:rubrerythrin